MVAGAAAAITAGVISTVIALQPPTPHAACVIAVDPQGSAAEMLATYRTWLPQEAQQCAAADRATLDFALISGETTTSTVAPVSTDLSKLTLTGNGSDDDTIVDSAIEKAAKRADEQILDAPTQTGGTDVLGIICASHDLLQGATTKTLVINSDAINNRAPYRLAHIQLGASDITKLIAELKSEGQLCDLTGTKVEMYGVGIGEGTEDYTAERLTEVHQFWEAAFKAAHADLITYQRNP